MPYKDIEKRRECKRRYYEKNKEKENARSRNYYKENKGKIKTRVFKHYGGDSPKCACCGEVTYEFLTIDHIHGKRKGDRKGGYVLYRWLIKNGFPDGFRILCYNCNCSRGAYGYCPHKKKVM